MRRMKVVMEEKERYKYREVSNGVEHYECYVEGEINMESNEDALCLQQIYSHLGVEAYGEDIQEQAVKEIDRLKNKERKKAKQLAIKKLEELKKIHFNPYIFTAKYECWSIRQTEGKHKYLILVEEEGKLKPAGSYSTKSKRLLMYNVKYTPPLTILEKIVTSCELFDRM